MIYIRKKKREVKSTRKWSVSDDLNLSAKSCAVLSILFLNLAKDEKSLEWAMSSRATKYTQIVYPYDALAHTLTRTYVIKSWMFVKKPYLKKTTKNLGKTFEKPTKKTQKILWWNPRFFRSFLAPAASNLVSCASRICRGLGRGLCLISGFSSAGGLFEIFSFGLA